VSPSGLAPVPRIGCVPYLNARPLLEGIGFPVTERVPSQLGDLFLEGKLDAALLSSIDVISMENPSVVDAVSISSRGAVFSVILAYQGELRDIKRVLLDPASHTSNALLQIILSEFHGLNPEYVRSSDIECALPLSDLDARLIIGDQAIEERKRTSSPGLRFLDLGEEWFYHTSHPFVFALWILRNEYPNKKELSRVLRFAKEQGLSKRSEIAARHPDPEFALRYISESIRYNLEDAEKQGLALFADYLKKNHIVTNIYSIDFF
jgi:predicted solute-binding protein